MGRLGESGGVDQGGPVVQGNKELIVWLIRFIWHLFCGFDKCMIDFGWDYDCQYSYILLSELNQIKVIYKISALKCRRISGSSSSDLHLKQIGKHRNW